MGDIIFVRETFASDTKQMLDRRAIMCHTQWWWACSVCPMRIGLVFQLVSHSRRMINIYFSHSFFPVVYAMQPNDNRKCNQMSVNASHSHVSDDAQLRRHKCIQIWNTINAFIVIRTPHLINFFVTFVNSERPLVWLRAASCEMSNKFCSISYLLTFHCTRRIVFCVIFASHARNARAKKTIIPHRIHNVR